MAPKASGQPHDGHRGNQHDYPAAPPAAWIGLALIRVHLR